MKKIVALVLLMAWAAIAMSQEIKHNYKPQDGYVPDSQTAIRIAEAVWLPIYGDRIYTKKPFTAQLKDGVWYVEGSLPEGWSGGVPEAEISKDSGCILRVSHGK